MVYNYTVSTFEITFVNELYTVRWYVCLVIEMKHNSGDLKVKWNHHGHKYKFILTQQELAQEDAFDVNSFIDQNFSSIDNV